MNNDDKSKKNRKNGKFCKKKKAKFRNVKILQDIPLYLEIIQYPILKT